MPGERKCVRELRWEVGVGGVRRKRKKYLKGDLYSGSEFGSALMIDT